MFHELSHSLGPGTINVGGRQTTVNAELKEVYLASEEAKADVMGLHNILYMMARGELPGAERDEALATYFAGIFRARARGRAPVQLPQGKGRVPVGARPAALPDRLRPDAARGPRPGRRARPTAGQWRYLGTKAFFERYAQLDNARTVLAGTAGIPTDIQPDYP